jgi:Tfp pilus assembly protein PilF
LEVLQIIDGILVRRRFITTDQILTCDSLRPHVFTDKIIQSMDPQTLRFRPKAGQTFHLSTPLTDTLIYASIGQVLGLPIDVALTPGNAFVKWRLSDSSHINWDTTIGLIRSDAEYAARLQITKAMIQNGIYLKPVPPDYLLATVFHRVGMAWGGEWRGLENGLKEKDPEKDPVRTQKAIDALTKAFDHNTKAYQTLIQRGQYWLRITEYEKAIDDNALALELEPDQPAGYFGRGLALLSRGDAKKAIDDFDKALSLNPDLPTSYYFRGLARAQIKQPNRAMEDLNKAIELEPRLVVAYQARAKVWEALGRNDKARDDDDRADALMGKKPK